MTLINTSLNTISEEINKAIKMLAWAEDILVASQDVEAKQEMINNAIILISEARKQLGDDENI